MFVPYSPTTNSSVNAQAPNFRPAMVQQFSLNAQGEFAKDWLLEIGYVGSPGDTSATLPFPESSAGRIPRESDQGCQLEHVGQYWIAGSHSWNTPRLSSRNGIGGSSWYNGLEVSLAKRLSHGLQFLASYTFSKTLDTDGADINSTSAGNALTLGDQNSPRQRWGRASFDRTHRFVFSETWSLPSPPAGLRRAVLGGWDFAAIVTIQSGSALTISATNANNVFGISTDRAQLSWGMLKKPIGQGRVGGVEIEWLFQCLPVLRLRQSSARMASEPRLGTARPGSWMGQVKRT